MPSKFKNQPDQLLTATINGTGNAAYEPLDLSTVEMPGDPPKHIMPRSPSSPRPLGVPEAPTFYPTEEQFADPYAYFSMISSVGSAYGIVKIVPPRSFRPPFSVDSTRFNFKVRKQELDTLEASSRDNLNFLDQLHKFHAQNGTSIRRHPRYNGKDIDLYTLKKCVDSFGGYEAVVHNNDKLLHIGQVLRLSKTDSSAFPFQMRRIYERYILPYDRYLKDNKSEVLRRREHESHVSASTAEKASDNASLSPSQSPDSPKVKRFKYATMNSACKECDQPLSESSNAVSKCCDCESLFHVSCLKQPSCNRSKEWYCDDCVVGTADYGFEDGDVYSLREFQSKSTEFTDNYIEKVRKERPTAFSEIPTEDEIEAEFWRLVENQDPKTESIEVEYGADIHSTTHGSGFPAPELFPLEPYSTHPWNLNVLPLCPPSLFCHIDIDISGMTNPWLYVGMMFSTFCWHVEDHMCYSANYQHFGATKTWYGIPASDADKFENLLKSSYPELFERQPDLLFQLVTLASPRQLLRNGAKCYAVNQRPGEFVITFPRAYHAGFNQGFNFNEAVNFAPYDWEPFGAYSVQLYKSYAKQNVFCHSKLLLECYDQDKSIETMTWLAPALKVCIDAEMRYRVPFGRKYPTMTPVIIGKNDSSFDEVSCSVCNYWCYLSFVDIAGTKYCLEHALKNLSKMADMSSDTYWYIRMTNEELMDIQSSAAAIANQPKEWVMDFRKIMASSGRIPLKKLKTILAAGEKIPIFIPEVATLRIFVDRANAYTENVINFLSRKLFNRRKNERAWRQPSNRDSPTDASDLKTVYTLADIENMVTEYEQISVEVPEFEQLLSRLDDIKALRQEAIAALKKTDITRDEISSIVEECRSNGVDLEEARLLKVRLERLDWFSSLKEVVPNRMTIQTFQALIENGKQYGVPKDNSDMKRLLDIYSTLLVWKEQVEKLKIGNWTFNHIDELLSQAESLPTDSTSLDLLRKIVDVGERTGYTLADIRNGLCELDFEKRPLYDDVRIFVEHLKDQLFASAGIWTLKGELKAVEAWERKGRSVFPRLLGSSSHSAVDNAILKVLTDLERCLDAKDFELKENPTNTNHLLQQTPTETETASLETFGNDAILLSKTSNLVTDEGSAVPKVHPETSNSMFCICANPDYGFMVECDICHEWYHVKCVGTSRKEVQAKQGTFQCPVCDWRMDLQRGAKSPTYDFIRSWHQEMLTLRCRPSSAPLLSKLVALSESSVITIRNAISDAAAKSDLTKAKLILRRMLGCGVFFVPEFNEIRRLIHQLSKDTEIPMPLVNKGGIAYYELQPIKSESTCVKGSPNDETHAFSLSVNDIQSQGKNSSNSVLRVDYLTSPFSESIAAPQQLNGFLSTAEKPSQRVENAVNPPLQHTTFPATEEYSMPEVKMSQIPGSSLNDAFVTPLKELNDLKCHYHGPGADANECQSGNAKIKL
ncbi:hypothetical protein CANCADRAFT_31936 [Tortispora caseinolytica NRRL Y-17796]|uniref:Uncharacterized protein n=1 Tax=Tortispora caseinolytica NRRL Y-17796 TaxID=767744 RepID=A0A1E4THJ7_9ASCO|nr:hypothetical protein CANCADRAFT_31936 [Tortispora caseinolytica NRRL Y-17796]